MWGSDVQFACDGRPEELQSGCPEGICLSAHWPRPLIFETLLDHNKNAIREKIVDIFHHLSSPSNGFSISWNWY